MPINMIPPKLPFESDCSPQEIFLQDFKIDLPISGAWGYSEQDAVVFDDGTTKSEYFSSFPIIVEKRIYEELIIFRSGWDRFSLINWDMVSQQLMQTQAGQYDYLVYNVTGLRDAAADFLQREFEENDGFSDDAEGMEIHIKKRESLTVSYEGHYWFKLPQSVLNA